MNIKIHSNELNRMLKTVTQCISAKDIGKLSNIEIICDNNLLTIRGSDGHFSAVMSTPMLGSDGEVFCVDGAMFAKVCAMCNGEITITTDGKFCTVKGAGRTRLPIVDAKLPAYEHVNGQTVTVPAEEFAKAYAGVQHAIASDMANRIQLTGVNFETRTDHVGKWVNMTALDGFQMSIEHADCEGDDMNVIIPGAFMKLIVQSTIAGETIKIRTDGKRLEALTDGMMLNCGLLGGEYPDVERILPKDFKTKCLVNAELLRNALKSGSVVNVKQNLVKIEISADGMKVMNNSEEADYEAEVPCEMQGEPLKIAFNQKYLMNTINSLDNGEIEMEFGTSVSPCIAHGKGEQGIRLILPVRVAG